MDCTGSHNIRQCTVNVADEESRQTTMSNVNWCGSSFLKTRLSEKIPLRLARCGKARFGVGLGQRFSAWKGQNNEIGLGFFPLAEQISKEYILVYTIRWSQCQQKGKVKPPGSHYQVGSPASMRLGKLNLDCARQEIPKFTCQLGRYVHHCLHSQSWTEGFHLSANTYLHNIPQLFQFVEFTHASQLTVRSNLERVSSNMRWRQVLICRPWPRVFQCRSPEDWKYGKGQQWLLVSKVCTFSGRCVGEKSWTKMIQVPMKLNCFESDKKTWRKIINRILKITYSYFGSASNKYLHIIIYTIWDPFAAFWTHSFHTFFLFCLGNMRLIDSTKKNRNCCKHGWLAGHWLPSDNLFKISWLPISWIDIKTVEMSCGLRICEDFSTKAGLNTALTGNVWENDPCLLGGLVSSEG